MSRNWLLNVCDKDRAHLSAPFTVVLRGQPYTVATKGTTLVELPGDCGTPMPDAIKQETVDLILAPTPDDATQFSFDTLRDFIRQHVSGAADYCGGCNDSGQIAYFNARGEGPNYTKCPECKGRSRNQVNVYIGDVLFNARLFVPFIENLTPTAPVLWHQATPTTRALIDGGMWRFIVMPLREDFPEPDAPRLNLSAPAASGAAQ